MPEPVSVAISHQGFIPRYRVRFFERLAALDGGIRYVVFHGPAPSGSGHFAASGPFAFPNVEVASRELRVLGKTAIYQPILRQLADRRYRAVVLGTHLQFLANHLGFALMRATGRPVLYWGHGVEKPASEAGPGGIRDRIGIGLKGALAKRVDGYLAYSEGGAQRLLDAGVAAERISVARNTLDMEDQLRLAARYASEDEAELRRRLGLREDSTVLVYLGRVYAEKRVDLFVEAVRRLRETGLDVEGVVIGDGPALPDVRRGPGAEAGLQFRGEVRDQDEIARHLRIAAAVVVPGAVGLAVNHAFAHATPLITREGRLHGPELEYVEPGRNGLVTGADEEGFVRELAGFARSAELRARLAAGAARTAEQLDLGPMVEAFDAAVRRVLERSG
jgi:glycosyltransferase involved in cell wall biosynthesis